MSQREAPDATWIHKILAPLLFPVLFSAPRLRLWLCPAPVSVATASREPRAGGHNLIDNKETKKDLKNPRVPHRVFLFDGVKTTEGT